MITPVNVFRKIAAAIAFDDGLASLISEALRFTKDYGDELMLVHVGQESSEKSEALQATLNSLQADHVQMHWIQGEKTEVLLDFVSDKEIDLLITATEEKENMAKYLLLGSLSRALCRKCRSSMLLLTHPSEEPSPMQRVVVSGVDHPKTAHTLDTVIAMSRRETIRQLIVVEELPLEQMVLSMESREMHHEDAAPSNVDIYANPGLTQQLDFAGLPKSLEWKVQKVEGKPGHCVSTFARETGADLLVVNSPDTELGLMDKVFPHDLEYALSHLPCNLLVIHPRNFDWN